MGWRHAGGLMCLELPELALHLQITRGQDVCAFLEALSSLGVGLCWDMTSGFASFYGAGTKSYASRVSPVKSAVKLVWYVLAAAKAATSSAGVQTRGKNDGKRKLFR